MTRKEWFTIYWNVMYATDRHLTYRELWIETEKIVKALEGRERYKNYESFKVAKYRYFAYGENT
jgi:hypothetical protein